MKYVITFLWSFVISQVTFYLGAALTGMSYDFTQAVILAIAGTLAVIAISKILPSITATADENK